MCYLIQLFIYVGRQNVLIWFNQDEETVTTLSQHSEEFYEGKKKKREKPTSEKQKTNDKKSTLPSFPSLPPLQLFFTYQPSLIKPLSV